MYILYLLMFLCLTVQYLELRLYRCCDTCFKCIYIWKGKCVDHYITNIWKYSKMKSNVVFPLHLCKSYFLSHSTQIIKDYMRLKITFYQYSYSILAKVCPSICSYVRQSGLGKTGFCRMLIKIVVRLFLCKFPSSISIYSVNKYCPSFCRSGYKRQKWKVHKRDFSAALKYSSE